MLKIVNTFLLSVGLWMIISCPAAAGVSDRYGNYFVTVEWLERHLDNDGITIIDARGEKAYKKGHIPGALPVSWKQLSDMSPEFCERNWGTVTDKTLLSKVISGLGIEKDTSIVIYADTRNGWGEDGRVFWTFKIAGLENLKILYRGLEKRPGILWWSVPGAGGCPQDRGIPDRCRDLSVPPVDPGKRAGRVAVLIPFMIPGG